MSPEASNGDAAPEGDSLVGKTLAGAYRLVEELGRGAMGIVYRAHNDVLDQDVAVKVLAPELAEDEHVRARLLQEARALTLLSHRHIVPVRHCGDEDGLLFVVMGLCPGETLGSILAREGALPEARARHIAEQVLEALEEAHASGIVHRDLKPENVMIERRTGDDGEATDFVHVLDFGLARIVGAARTNMPGAMVTMDGDVVGTVAYMSPEQVRAAGDVDARSDLFSLGILLYEMLAGSLPFESDSALSVMMRIMEAPPRPLPAAAPRDVSQPMHAVVMRALMKDREDRFQSATDFLASLRGDLDPRDASARKTAATAAEPHRPLTPWGLARDRRLWIGAAAALAVYLGATWLMGAGARSARERADEARAACDHKRTVYHFEQVAREQALTGDDLLALARARIEVGDNEAERDLANAEQLLGPADARVHVERGRLAWLVENDVGQALSAFATAVVNDATSIEGLYWRARMLLDPDAHPAAAKAGVEPEAMVATDIETMERRAAGDARVPLIAGRLLLLQLRGTKEPSAVARLAREAIERFEKAEELDPKAAEPAWRIADVHGLVSQRAKEGAHHEQMHTARRESLAALDRAVERLEAAPTHGCQVAHRTDIYRQRSFVRLSLGDTNGAIEDMRTVYASGTGLAEYVEMAEGLRVSGRLDEAIELYLRLIEATQDSQAYFNLGYCYERRAYVARLEDKLSEATADYGRAADAFTNALAGTTSPPLVRAYRGEVYLRRSAVDPSQRDADLERARDDFESAAHEWDKYGGGRAELDHRYAAFLCRVGDVDTARTRLADTIGRTAGLTPAIHARMAWIYLCSAAREPNQRLRHLADADNRRTSATGIIGHATYGTHLLRGEIALARALLGPGGIVDQRDLEGITAAFREAEKASAPFGAFAKRRSRLALVEAELLAAGSEKIAEAHRAAWRSGSFGPDAATYGAMAEALEALGPERAADAALARTAEQLAPR